MKETVKGLWRNHRGFILFLAVMAVARSSFADHNYIPSSSMTPNLVVGDDVLVNKLAYDLKVPFTTLQVTKWADPKRGEIVVFYSPTDGTRLIKRVIGVPGDKISMQDGELQINGKVSRQTPVQMAAPMPVESGLEPHDIYVEHQGKQSYRVAALPERVAMRSFAEITIPDGQYFMMGDNRDNSHDSRYIGLVPRTNILGRAEMVLLSYDTHHYYLPRSERFFSSLRVNPQ